MDGRGDQPVGSGSGPDRPDFAPPTSPTYPPPAAFPRPTSAVDVGATRPPGPAGPPRSRLPQIVTGAAVGVVVAVVAAATLVAHHADTHVAAPVTPPRVIVSTPASRADRVPFQTSTGTGELVLVQRRWVTHGSSAPQHGSYLKVEVEVTCDSGTVAYDPFDFQAFDADGNLYDLLLTEADEPVLETGVLEPGGRARGGLAFDIPHGAVTLLMSEANEQSVTAIAVPV